MDNFDFNTNENKSDTKDIYFSNEISDVSANRNTNRTAAATQTKKKKKKGAGSTYVFFIVVIVVSMIVSVYAIFCMNDILAITKTKSNVTVSFTQDIKDS